MPASLVHGLEREHGRLRGVVGAYEFRRDAMWSPQPMMSPRLASVWWDCLCCGLCGSFSRAVHARLPCAMVGGALEVVGVSVGCQGDSGVPFQSLLCGRMLFLPSL